MSKRTNKFYIVAVIIGLCLMAGIKLLKQHSDHPLFYFGIGFGILVIAIIIGSKVFNKKVTGSSQATPWMQNIRQFQNERENAGWRIQMIPYDDLSKPMMMQANGIAAVGAISFALGIILMTHSHNAQNTPVINLIHSGDNVVRMGLWMTVGGLFLAFFGIWFNGRKKRKDWEVVTARCVDRELREAQGRVWFWRIVCEYEYGGNKYRFTPIVYRSNFTSEGSANKFIGSRVSTAGECKLHINPKNPLQTELVG
jgi:hypothetical protein